MRRGARGEKVRVLQLLLNAQLQGPHKIRPDGHFGPKTEKALRRFQELAALEQDGVAGLATMAALNTKPPSLIKLKKYRDQLGIKSDFVTFLRDAERKNKDMISTIDSISDFSETAQGKRYYLSTLPPGVIDFRHFFAAFAEAYSGRRTNGFGRGVGNTLMLGLANEVFQCLDEASRAHLNSCFAREDLGSNRLGAAFAREVTILQSTNRLRSLADTLDAYLSRVAPQPTLSRRSAAPPLPGLGGQLLESVRVIGHFLDDLLLPKAY